MSRFWTQRNTNYGYSLCITAHQNYLSHSGMYKLMNFKFSDAPTKRPSDSPTGDDKYRSEGVKKKNATFNVYVFTK